MQGAQRVELTRTTPVAGAANSGVGVANTATGRATRLRGFWRAWRGRLLPLSSGPQEIAALDGLRALAALSVLVYHATSVAGARLVVAGHDLTWTFFYTESGVDLFFTLSGFLLFLPYARAMLDRSALPDARMFYRRRALRILPAYYVCLAALVVTQWPTYSTPVGIQNVLAHLALLHDIAPPFNRTISGPFWTLAVEWQFYLLLPLIAWAIARVAAGSPRRLLAGILGMIAAALALREGDALLNVHRAAAPHAALPWIDLAQRIVIGSQGKYLEVFGVGMLCSVAYTLIVRRVDLRGARRPRLVGVALLALALLTYLSYGPLVYERRNAILAAFYLALRPTDIIMLVGPLLLGVGYGALTLGVLLAPRLVRAPFEWGALRFVGLISYSLYLWHETIINLVYPHLAPIGALRLPVALGIGVLVAIPFAYLSYQLIERPFLRRRRNTASAAGPTPAAPSADRGGRLSIHLSARRD